MNDTSAAAGLRIPLLTIDDLDARQRQIVEDPGYLRLMETGPGLSGQAGFLLRSPEMFDPYAKLGLYCKCDSSLPPRLNELTILLVARLWTTQYLWTVHVPLARKAGLSDAVIADLREGRRPGAPAADEAAVFDYCVELNRNHSVRDPTYQQLAGFFDQRQIIDVTAVLGYYVMVSMFVNSNRLPPRDNDVAPLAPMKDPFTGG
jgi:4-carboxymuconolactone decarboxylase